MKKSYLIIISVLIIIIGALLAYIFLFSDRSDNVPEAQADVDNQQEEVTIQEDQGDIVITIPDDMESAGE